MKTKQTVPINLVEGGKENWQKTNEFNSRVNAIKKELTDKYSLTLLNERNWVKRLLIKIRLHIEISKRIDELSSLRNLHIINH